MRFFLVLALLLSPALAGAQATQPQPDMGTILWLQTLRAHPELSPAGIQIASNPIQDRYNQLLRQALKQPAPAPKTSTAPLLSGPIEIPTADSATTSSGTPVIQSARNAPSAAPRALRRPRPAARLTPYQMCLRDGGCDGLGGSK